MSDFGRRVRFELAYDGTDFCGWQFQPRDRTVQGVVESVLSTLAGGDPVAVRGAGRTDAGVHARGQVADARIVTRLSDARLLAALNDLLPADVRARALTTVPEGFHSRHGALSKSYDYLLDRSEAGDPFLARYALHHPFEIHAEAVRDALLRLPGRRDWSGFAASSCEKEDRVRHLTHASFEESANGTARFRFTADGFLTHMVRNLVGTLLEVARGKCAPEWMDAIVASGDRNRAGPTAPARGLCLVRVEYEREDGGGLA